MNLDVIGASAVEASRVLAAAPLGRKDEALRAMAAALRSSSKVLLDANAADLTEARGGSVPSALIDRLTLDEARITKMADALIALTELPDPIGEVMDRWVRPNGLRIERVRVPIGVVAVIYEARPNVTSDVAGLCLKSGNAAILRGSHQAMNSNLAIVNVLREAIASAGLPRDCVQYLEDPSHESALELMKLDRYIDLLVPRGGAELIATIRRHATVPYIIDGDGNCHVYIDRSADPDMATEVIVNAKVQRPTVCNAAETLLVHEEIAASWLPGALDALRDAGVEIRGDARTRALWPSARPADESDWATEYLALILAVRVVDSLDEAIAHVNRWGTSNAEAIVTSDEMAASRFVREVDAGSVFVNASTRFNDGGEFGYGAEIGISTQKLHARGPMGVRELTTYRNIVTGSGQVRR